MVSPSPISTATLSTPPSRNVTGRSLRDVPVVVGGHHRGRRGGVLLRCPRPGRALGHADVQGLESLPRRHGHQA